MWQVAVRIFEMLLKRGDHALLENPRSSELGKTSETNKNMKMSSVIAVDTDMCQLGLKHAMTKDPPQSMPDCVQDLLHRSLPGQEAGVALPVHRRC